MAESTNVKTMRAMDELRGSSGSLVTQGVLEMVAGVLLLFMPLFTSLMVIWMMGLAVIISGVLQMAGVIGHGRWWARMLLGILTVVAGLLILGHPMFGLAFLTLLIASYFMAVGILRIITGTQIRGLDIGAGWMMFSGAISILLSLVIFAGWPGASVRLISLLVAINLLVGGMTTLTLGLETKNLEKVMPVRPGFGAR